MMVRRNMACQNVDRILVIIGSDSCHVDRTLVIIGSDSRHVDRTLVIIGLDSRHVDRTLIGIFLRVSFSIDILKPSLAQQHGHHIVDCAWCRRQVWVRNPSCRASKVSGYLLHGVLVEVHQVIDRRDPFLL